MYVDKLDGKIDPALGDRFSAGLRCGVVNI
jgi:hypothetical protein